jgi:hypothetical protein
MSKTSLGFIAIAAILGIASAHAQGGSASPIQGNPSKARPAPVAPSTTGAGPATPAAPNSAAPNTGGASHMPGGNPDRAPASTQTHEPPAK